MIIALIGPSGSGKTTIINNLKNWNYFKNKKVIIRKEDDFKIIRLAKFILGDKIFTEYKEQKFFIKDSKSIKSTLFSWVVYWFYPLAIYCEFLWTYFLYSTIWNNRVLLCDRYIYDYLVTLEEMLDIHNPVARFLIYRFPKPYSIFYLSINKDTSLTRNKDNIEGKITSSIILHESVIKKYNDLVRRLKILTIKNDNNILHTLSEIKDYIYALKSV